MKDDLISRQAAIDAMMKLQTEDIEAYGASIPEGFDGDRAVTALKALPSATDINVGGNLIDRRAALDALGERPTVWTDDDDYALGERNQYDMDRLAIETVPSAQPGWIPTSQKPPEPFKLVLIQDYCGCYELNTYIPPRINPKQYPNGYWGDVDCVDYDYLDVYAWYPLPKEYRPEGEEQ